MKRVNRKRGKCERKKEEKSKRKGKSTLKG
jgi:hypothetical protein